MPGPTTPATTGPARKPRIAYLSFGTGEYDARTFRMARSAIRAGYDVTVYARWYPGRRLPLVEQHDGFRLVRVPFEWQLAVPGLRGWMQRRLAPALAASAARTAAGGGGPATVVVPPARPLWRRIARRTWRVVGRPYRGWRRLLRLFPLFPLGWAAALEDAAEPADIWHGMWAGSLPALLRLRRRHGGRAIYDSRDVFMQAREMAAAGWPGRAVLEHLERRWARSVDHVLTVNDDYARLLVEQLHIAPPTVVMNFPERWSPPAAAPDHIRQALGLAPETAVVLYQGGLMTGRGIEQCMEAITLVPGAVLCLLGFGRLRETLEATASQPRYGGRVRFLEPVPPEALLAMTASADVSVMAIQPGSINHRYTTPQKLFESMAAGIPVVASDLPGMATIVRETGVGRLCDPTDPASIATAIHAILDAPADERERLRARILEVAHARVSWETQVGTLLAVYRELLGDRAAGADLTDPTGDA